MTRRAEMTQWKQHVHSSADFYFVTCKNERANHPSRKMHFIIVRGGRADRRSIQIEKRGGK